MLREGPGVVYGELIEGGVWEVVGAVCLSGGAGGVEDFCAVLAAGEGVGWELEGAGGDGGDALPIFDVLRGAVEVF